MDSYSWLVSPCMEFMGQHTGGGVEPHSAAPDRIMIGAYLLRAHVNTYANHKDPRKLHMPSALFSDLKTSKFRFASRSSARLPLFDLPPSRAFANTRFPSCHRPTGLNIVHGA